MLSDEKRKIVLERKKAMTDLTIENEQIQTRELHHENEPIQQF